LAPDYPGKDPGNWAGKQKKTDTPGFGGGKSRVSGIFPGQEMGKAPEDGGRPQSSPKMTMNPGKDEQLETNYIQLLL